ncbi:uncharacterized protein LOC118147698 [Callithrix jacchus]
MPRTLGLWLREMGRLEAPGGPAVPKSPNTPSRSSPYNQGFRCLSGPRRASKVEATGQTDQAIRCPAGRAGSGKGPAQAGGSGRNSPSEARWAAPPGGRGRSGAVSRERCRRAGSRNLGAGWRRSPTEPGRRADRPHGAQRTAFVRLVGDGARLGCRWRQARDRLEQRAPRRWPRYLPRAYAASLPPPAATRLFISTSLCGGGGTGGGDGGGSAAGGRRVPGALHPVYQVQPPGRPRAARHSGRAHPVHPHSRLLPPSPERTRAPLTSGMLAQKAWDTSLLRLSPGTLRSCRHTQSLTMAHRRPLLCLQSTSRSARTDMHTFVHMCTQLWP